MTRQRSSSIARRARTSIISDSSNVSPIERGYSLSIPSSQSISNAQKNHARAQKRQSYIGRSCSRSIFPPIAKTNVHTLSHRKGQRVSVDRVAHELDKQDSVLANLRIRLDRRDAKLADLSAQVDQSRREFAAQRFE